MDDLTVVVITKKVKNQLFYLHNVKYQFSKVENAIVWTHNEQDALLFGTEEEAEEIINDYELIEEYEDGYVKPEIRIIDMSDI